MTAREKVENEGNNPEARALCPWDHNNEEEYCSCCEGIEIGLNANKAERQRALNEAICACGEQALRFKKGGMKSQAQGAIAAGNRIKAALAPLPEGE